MRERRKIGRRAAKWLRAFGGDRNANVAMMFGLAVVPFTYLAGMEIDYTQAALREQQLNAAADAAALAALSPPLLTQPDAASIAAATASFNAQVGSINGINYSPANLHVTISDTATTRTANVSFTATSTNSFAQILGVPTLALAGNSQATTRDAPNINFYLVLDDSPSMAVAASQTDINTMVNHTASQGGCAFGCHETHPSSDNLGNPGGIDNYALAKSLNVTLRVDLLRKAAQDLMTTAQSAESYNNAQYKMAIYTFDWGFNTIQTMTSNLATAGTSAGTIDVQTVYANNWLTSSNKNSDMDTDYDKAMTGVNTIMPNPGTGTNAAGDTPQEVMFFVTDGVEDEDVGGGRHQSLMDNGWCTTIKNRGIRIAVLYTTYLPLPTNAWYNTYISPFQANIGTTLQNCASPGLYFEVKTGGDISTALSDLFRAAIQIAHLTQ